MNIVTKPVLLSTMAALTLVGCTGEAGGRPLPTSAGITGAGSTDTDSNGSASTTGAPGDDGTGGSGSASSGEGGTTSGAGTSTGVSTSGGSTGDDGSSSSGGASAGTTGAGTTGGSTTGAKFDVGGSTGGMGGSTGGGCGGNVVDFSYIWISNSPEGTVSKIDTQTLVEEGRYVVSANPSLEPKKGPSRTSVNLDGDVAVADRDGGLLKIHARKDDCADTNGTPGIQTSTGPQDVLAWGEEECVAWRIELPQRTRPVAWTAPEEIGPCQYDEPKIWVASPEGTGPATVYLVSGSDGAVEVEIDVPDCNCDWYGLYGGAVDAENRFWTFPREGPNGHGTGDLFRFDADTKSYDRWTPPAGVRSYGIVVAQDGRVWLAGDSSSLAYFDPMTETFTQVATPQLPASNYVLRGLMQDATGDLWIAALNGWNQDAGPPGMLRVDGVNAVTLEFIDDTVLTGLLKPAGTSIDVDGYVWLVDTVGNQAFRYDPINASIQIASGLVSPYTYSDMTGFGLKNVIPG